jgi:hypothetical protein
MARHQVRIGNLGGRIQDGVAGGKTVTEKLVTPVERHEENAESEMMIENAVRVGGRKVAHQDQGIEMKREHGMSGSKTFQESLEGCGVIVESDGDGGSIS